MTDWYVDQAGGGDGSLATPWSRAEAVTNQASVLAGDTVWLLDAQTGSWVDIAFANGTAANRITIRGDYPGRAFSLTYSGAARGVAQVMDFDGLDGLDVRDITVSGPAITGIRFNNCDDLNLHNIYADDAEDDGVQIKVCNNVFATGFIEGHNCGDTHGSAVGIGRGIGLSGAPDAAIFSGFDFRKATLRATGNGRRGITISGNSTWVSGEPNLQSIMLGDMYITGNGSGLDIDNCQNVRCSGKIETFSNNLTGEDSGNLDENRGFAITDCVDVVVSGAVVHGHNKEAVYINGSVGQPVTNCAVVDCHIYNNDLADTRNYAVYLDNTLYLDSVHIIANRIGARNRAILPPEQLTHGYITHNNIVLESGGGGGAGDVAIRFFVASTGNYTISNNIISGFTQPIGSSSTGHSPTHENNLYFGYTSFDIGPTETDREVFEPSSYEFDPMFDANIKPELRKLTVARRHTISRGGVDWWASSGVTPYAANGKVFSTKRISVGHELLPFREGGNIPNKRRLVMGARRALTGQSETVEDTEPKPIRIGKKKPSVRIGKRPGVRIG